jgi:DNA adenine methylase
MPPIVPPIKCQGIKTKIIPAIKSVISQSITGRWIEPFCGSCVVAFNIQPQRAILADTNQHIINFYSSIQTGSITPGIVTQYLKSEGEKLRTGGEKYYYEVRKRFNECGHPLDFLFLNRSCFNGVVRFNKKGEFNVPFCRKPERFSQAYITKISNQVRVVSDILRDKQWSFEVADFKSTLSKATDGDVVYADPPYIGRHVDYFNTWNETDERTLIELLKQLPCSFILSTWQQNKYRHNPNIQEHWQAKGINIVSVNHFYHVGSSEDLRHDIVEAVITNGDVQASKIEPKKSQQLSLGI